MPIKVAALRLHNRPEEMYRASNLSLVTSGFICRWTREMCLLRSIASSALLRVCNSFICSFKAFGYFFLLDCCMSLPFLFLNNDVASLILYWDAETGAFLWNRSINLSGPDALAQGDDVSMMMMSWILHVCLDLMLLTGCFRVPKSLFNSLFSRKLCSKYVRNEKWEEGWVSCCPAKSMLMSKSTCLFKFLKQIFCRCVHY